MSTQISWNIDIRRELARNPFGNFARFSSPSDRIDGLRTVICTFLPSYFSTDLDDAKKTAENIGAECVRIVVVHEWDGDIKPHFAGWGWQIDDALLGTEDFTWEELQCH